MLLRDAVVPGCFGDLLKAHLSFPVDADEGSLCSWWGRPARARSVRGLHAGGLGFEVTLVCLLEAM